MVLAPVLFFTVTTATVLFVMGSVALWVLRRFAETETPVPFAEGMLRRVGRVQEVVTGEQGGQSTRSDVDVKRENGHREQDVKVNGELRAKEPVMG